MKKRYSKAPASKLMKVKKRHWHLRELRALEKACKHYAPILGKPPRGEFSSELRGFSLSES